MEMDYELLSSTRYASSQFLLLHYHHDRLVAAAEKHDWDAAANLTFDTLNSVSNNAVTQADKQTALKVRLTLSKAGVLSATVSPVHLPVSNPVAASLFTPSDDPAKYGPIISLFVDSQPTPSSIFTRTKTTNRPRYNEAATRFRSSPPHTDVLLYNEHGFLTETCIYNVALYRENRWKTPNSTSGCLPGVFRRSLLEQGQVTEDEQGALTVDSVKEGDWVLLFNGVQGCRLGQIVKPQSLRE